MKSLLAASLPIIAIALVAWAQYVLTVDSLLFGGVLLAIGATLFARTAPAPRSGLPLAFPREPESLAAERPRLEAPCLTGATTTFLLCLTELAARGETFRGRMLWCAAIALLFLSQSRRRSPVESSPTDARFATASTLALLLGAGLAMRLVRLTTLPFDLDGDFASWGLQARELATGTEIRLFDLGWAYIPTIGYLPSTLTMKVLGTGLVGLNAAGVILGVLVLLGTYWLGRDLYAPRVGLIAASLSCISYVHLHFSRTSAYIDPVFYTTFGLYFLLVGLRRGGGLCLPASSLLCSMAFLSYYSGRLVAPLVATVFVALAFTRPRWLADRRRSLAIWVLGCVIVAGPYALVYADQPEGFNRRTASVFLFDPDVLEHSRLKYGVDDTSGVLWEQAKRTFWMFHVFGDTGTQFGLRAPFLDDLAAPFFSLGLVLALRHPGHLGNLTLVSWIAWTLFLGSFLTVNPPFWPRLVGVIVPATLLAAVAIDSAFRWAQECVRGRHRKLVDSVVGTAFVLALFVTGISNWRLYVSEKGSRATPRTLIARHLAARPPDERFVLVTEPFRFRDREFEFLAPGRLKGELDAREVRSAPIRRGTSLILTPNHEALIPDLRRRFPDGRVQAVRGSEAGEVVFGVFTVPRRRHLSGADGTR